MTPYLFKDMNLITISKDNNMIIISFILNIDDNNSNTLLKLEHMYHYNKSFFPAVIVEKHREK